MAEREFTPTKGLIRPKTYPPRIVNLAGQQFDRLFVLGYAGRTYKGYHFWLCRCACGTPKTVCNSHLTDGSSKSCGCYGGGRASNTNRTHGMTRQRIYCLWSDMLTRCNNPKFKQYADYGGRGIKVCERWREFENFYADMGEPPSPSHSLDRIDNSLGYSPENVRWASRIEQANNKRNNRLITCNGETHTLSDWGRIRDMKAYVIQLRLKRGWSPEEACGFKEHVRGQANPPSR
jgi:hypothetical protein